MTQPTFAQWLATQQGSPGHEAPDDVRVQALAALAVLASGQNPDGTAFSMPVVEGAAQAANILNGELNVTANTGSTTIVTVPAGRTWVGSVSFSSSVGVSAASTVSGFATGTLTTAGVGVTPPAAEIARCTARAGANAATGTVGSQGSNALTIPKVTVIAPAGNSVSIQASASITGSFGEVCIAAVGSLK